MELKEETKKRIAELIDGDGQKLEGWATIEKATAMTDLILELKPKTVVEIGVFGGRSLIPQGMALRDLGFGHIFGIDPWKTIDAIEGNPGEENIKWWSDLDLHDIHKGCMKAIWKEELDNWITILRCTSIQALALIPKIDILHIDGNHTELASCRDVDYFLPNVRRGGYVWFDDIDWPSTKAAIQKLEAQCKRIKEVGNCALFQNLKE